VSRLGAARSSQFQDRRNESDTRGGPNGIQLDDGKRPMIFSRGQGGTYDMGRMRAVFVADGDETDTRYSISEWWLEPRTAGPGAHSHAEDHIFYVLTGMLHLFVDGQWSDAPRGSYAVIPGGVEHDFQNRTGEEYGFISINAPGGFEKMMPHLVAWFAQNPLGDAQGAQPAIECDSEPASPQALLCMRQRRFGLKLGRTKRTGT
jgi:quercetin dioxygenase-like cupin family protein